MLKFLLFSAYILSDFFTPQGNFISHLATVRMIQKDIYAWDIQDAEKKLKKLPKNSPFFSYLKGYILFFNGNYKEAMSYLEKAVDELNSSEAINLYNLVKNTYEETKDFKHVETPHFIISYMPGKSEILIPMAKETLEKAWENVGEDLGYYPLEKIRVEIYPYYESFMRISTLTRKDIETSGTIALCNYHRIMITSPAATLHGYRWRDTLNHEMVHYFLTRMTRNYAPLWLQEGVAKAEETRWRKDGPKPLSPLAQTALINAIKKNNFVTFKEMIPSFAKLGSSERVTLAFAEVLSMVRMIIQKGGYSLLRRLILSSVKYRGNSEKMIKSIGYRSLNDFLAKWKNYIKHQKLVDLDFEPSERIALKRENISEKYFRLGEMLKDRAHFASAAYEYGKAIKKLGKFDPVLNYKYAFALFHSGKVNKAEEVLKRSLLFSPDYESMHTLLAYVYLKQNDYKSAISEFQESLSLNPFNPLIHAGLIEIYSKEREEKELKQEKQILRMLQYGG